VKETVTWRARLRFRLQKKIRIEGNEHRLQIAGREVVLTPPTPDLKIMDSDWLIMNARGFASEDEARQFGNGLKTALEVSAVGARVGVDTGRNLATSALGKIVKDALGQGGRPRARQHPRPRRVPGSPEHGHLHHERDGDRPRRARPIPE